MSIYDKASLVLIPSGTKTSKVYSQKPTNGDGDFTFSRSTAATRVNASGNIEKETGNLILQSNSFNTTWTKSTAITATSGQSGYDGSSDAWLLERSDGSARYIQQSVSLSGVNTFSFYAKADNENWVFVATSSGNAQCYYNLSNGSIGTKGSLVVDANAEDIGSGWYRVSMTINGTFTYVRIYPAVGNESVSGATDASIFIQDSQIEQGLVARDYIETTTTAIYGGITDNVPRLDYTDSSCPALLLEPQRTNLVTQSEYYDTGNGYFNSFGLHDIVTNTTATTSPTGDYSATKIIPDTSGSSNHNIYGSNVTSGTKYAVSIFAKAAEYDYLIIRGLGLGGSGGARFNISTGVVEGVAGYDSATIEDYGNGWYRCIAIGTATSTTGAYYHASPTATFTSFQGNNSDGIYIYGAQVEAGSYATSYIPTYGSAVTRAYDNQDATGLSTNVFNNDNFTLFYDFDYNANGREGSTTAYRIFSGSSQLGIKGRSGSSRSMEVYSSGDFSGSIVFNNVANASRIKVALRVTNGTCELFFNGTKDSETIDVSGAAPYNWAQITMLGSSSINTSLNQCLGFPTALTDQEAIDLTTL